MANTDYKKNKAVRSVALWKGQMSHRRTEFLCVSWQPALPMSVEHRSPANTLVKGHYSSMPFPPRLVRCKERLGPDIPNVLPSDNHRITGS